MSSLRAKLLVLLGVPVAALVVLGGIGLRSAQQQFHEVRDHTALADLNVTAENAALMLAHERRTTLLDPDGADGADVVVQQSLTDHALDALGVQLDNLPDGVDGDEAQAVRDAVADVPRLRDSLDETISAGEVQRGYREIITPLLALDPGSLGPDDVIAGRQRAQRALVQVVNEYLLEDDLVREAAASGVLDDGIYQQLVATGTASAVWEDQFRRTAPEAQAEAYDQALEATFGPADDRVPAQLRAAGPAATVDEAAGDWTAAVDEAVAHLDTVVGDGSEEVREMIDGERQAGARARLAALGWFGAALFAAVALLLALWRKVLLPLRTTADDAHQAVTDTEQALASGDLSDLTGMPRQTGTDLSTISRSVGALQLLAAALIKERTQATGDRSEVYLNFGRRAQHLVTQQLNQIDGLEARTDNPDLLSELFTLDHLTTRLRRTAESLILLAGSDTDADRLDTQRSPGTEGAALVPSTDAPRRWTRPISAVNVIRAATAETVDYSRVRLARIDSGSVTGAVATEVSHLLAELIDNGLVHSPSETEVILAGEGRPDGTFVISISNVGPDMSPEDLDAATTHLHDPMPVPADGPLPLPFGLYVAGCLAGHHGIEVRLDSSPLSGTRAEVDLPRSVMVLPAEAVTAPPANVDDRESVTTRR